MVSLRAMISFKPTINTAMLIGSLAIGLLITATAWLALETTRTIQQSTRVILAENVSSLKASEELEIALLDQKGIVSNYLLDGDERRLAPLEEKRRTFEEWFTRARQVAFTEREQQVLERIRSLYQEYDRLRSQVITLHQTGHPFEARQLLLNDLKRLMDQLHQACEELLYVNEQLIIQSQQRSEHHVHWMQWVVWGGIAAAMVLGLLGGGLFARGVTRRLVRAEQLATLGEMAGLVAHEVRNPLTAIKMRAHALEEEAAYPGVGQDDLRVIRQEVERLERIVQNCLDLAKLPEPRLMPVQLNDVIATSLRVVQPALQQQAIQVEARLDRSLPTVQGDAEQLQQVFLNLMRNAAQAMRERGVIRIATRPVAVARADGGQVEVIISDTGPGIPDALRRKVFDPFFTTKADGIGLGLALAKKIVDQHHGSIAFARGEDVGATVAIRLPAAEGMHGA